MLRVSHNFPQGRERAEEPQRNTGALGGRAGRHRTPQIILGRNEWSGIKFGVFGLAKPKLAITEEQRDWINRSFVGLGSLVRAHRLFEAELILPTPEHFPDRYERSGTPANVSSDCRSNARESRRGRGHVVGFRR